MKMRSRPLTTLCVLFALVAAITVHTVKMDKIIERVAEPMKGTATLILFTADHSYDMRLSEGSDIKGESIVRSMVVVGNHAGEEVLVAAQGPGAEKVRGFMRNTQLFDVMMDALGWEKNSHK
jgi:alkaline phosphatase